jgi:hypothetical protein
LKIFYGRCDYRGHVTEPPLQQAILYLAMLVAEAQAAIMG